MRLARGTAVVAFALLALAGEPARAAFEQPIGSVRGLAMGGAMTALQDEPAAQLQNPATLGTIDDPAFSMNYLRQFHAPAGETNQDFFDALGALPVKQELINGTFGTQLLYNRQLNYATERAVGLGFGTRALWQSEDKHLDAGGAFRTLKKTFDAQGGAPMRLGLDAGLLFRWGERYAFGFSLLNFDGPPMQAGTFKDRAPAEARLGFSESVRGFTLTLDAAKREPSLDHPGTAEIAGGFERWWATPRAGSYALRSGLSLGDRDKVFTWGLGWRMFGAELNYAMTVPMTGKTLFGHAVGLTFRFGQSNPEAEYEKVLATEIRYRKDLVEALEAGEVKQWKLAEELTRMREEMDALRGKLAQKASTELETRRRMHDLEERHRRAVETFERMKRESEGLKTKTQQALYDEDWQAYQRLKTNGAPDSVLIDHVKRLLQQYKDSAVDLSEANQELVRLLRSR
jgi:hypothetical protein